MKIKRANILLLVNTWKPDFEIAELLHTSWLTVLRTRHRFVEGGLDFALRLALPASAGFGRKRYQTPSCAVPKVWANARTFRREWTRC